MKQPMTMIHNVENANLFVLQTFLFLMLVRVPKKLHTGMRIRTFFMTTKLNVHTGINIHCKFNLLMIHNTSLFKHEFYSGTNIQFRYHKKSQNFHDCTYFLNSGHFKK